MNSKLSRWLLYVLLIFSTVSCANSQVVAIGARTNVDPSISESASVELDADVSPETVADLVEAGTVAIIDVREAWEYQEGHISDATLISLGTLERRIDEIPTDKPVILVCRSGNRSGQAYRYLMREGFDNVHNMTGGMIAWEAAGFDVAR